MTVDQAIDTVLTIASAAFPFDPDIKLDPETRTRQIRVAIEKVLDTRGIHTTAKLFEKHDPPKECKVVIYATTSTNVSHPQALRNYRSRGSSLDPTIVETLCATLATPQFFAPVKIGARGREQDFVGGPVGVNNPTRELLKEANIIYSGEKRVAQIISLGAGLPSTATSHIVDQAKIAEHYIHSLITDCETVASELYTRLLTVNAYVRFNVNFGTETLA
ncbi:hypothetical protein M408DRAFT_157562 [Serendipita vermifera MAFF 305830]|uniref:PNPLA domain-containing protein n=1 Tax=Serendipita vermifera MAFF 305830 TaxID=933852 RepID=A0A0C3BNF6_SERVB|nr:hypothetical protein M408DRAFT_157562 [Serendipita vermifera MAFF 305830]